MNNKLYCLLLLLVTIGVSHLTAQETDKHEIKLLARPMPDSIMLRWAPNTYQLWITGNQIGYTVTRTLFYQNGQMVSGATPQQLNPLPLKPALLPQWEKAADQNDLAAIAAQAIYGDDFEIDAGQTSDGIMAKFDQATVQETRFGFALLAADKSSEVAHLSGLAWTDKTAKKGCKYLYKVYLSTAPSWMTVDTAVFYTGVDEYLPIPAPANVQATPGDKMTTLTWDRLGQAGLFSGYFIERSANNNPFEAVNTSALINTTPEGKDEAPFHFYIDSLANNEQVFSYRIRGITPFGELSPWSEVVKTQGKEQILVAPNITKLFSPNNQSVQIEWEMQQDIHPQTSWIRVLRSPEYSGPFTAIADSLPLQSAQYIDKQPLTTGYYTLQACNKNGNGPTGMARLVQLIDSIPPLAPMGLVATADTTGRVELRWLPNNEDDIYGYRVFRANGANEEYSQITVKPLPDTVYIDKIDLHTLTKQVYYKVVAIDNRQNRSDFSAAFEMERPDIVPPSPAAIRGIRTTDTGIELTWYPSSSVDAATQYLYRNSNQNSQWTLIAQLAPADTVYRDTTVTEMLYRYLLVTADKTGNESAPTKSVAAKYSKPLASAVWITPKVKLDKKTDLLIITWDKTATNATHVMLYGKNKEGQWRTIMRVENSGVAEVGSNRGFDEYRIK